jgi:sugar phosphate isomerase/epimerase
MRRRDFGSLVFSGMAAAMAGRALAGQQTPVRTMYRGVRFGVQSASFTFSGLGLTDIVGVMQRVGLAEVDVMVEHIEHFLGAPGVVLPGTGRQGPWARAAGSAAAPAAGRGAGAQPAAGRGGGRGGDPAVREALRQWRLDVPLERYEQIRRMFADAGLRIFSLNMSFNDTYSDAEIERGMAMAQALGTRVITASSPLTVLPRVGPLAEKHDVTVAIHNHTTGPAEFAQAMAVSPRMWVNLDVGHFFAMGHDPVAYLRQHHARITNLHVKDRQRNQGREMPFGQGDTPLGEVLALVRQERYDIPVCIEHVGPDGPQVELQRCFDYLKAQLPA